MSPTPRKRILSVGRMVFLAWLMVLLSAPAVLAHKVYLFSWVEGDMVHVEAYFNKSRKVKGGKIIILDASGQKLLEGQTDDNGLFSFKAPIKADLTVVLEASMGHRNEWIIPADELPDVGGAAEPGDSTVAAVDVPEAKPAPVGSPTKEVNAETFVPVQADPEQIRKIIDEALEARLKPLEGLPKAVAGLQQAVIELRKEEQKPGWVEIIGGLGWIFGIMGLAMYLRSRKK